jgi:hypothetical protein
MRKHLDIIINQVSVPQINLDIGIGFTLSSVGSTPDHQKYHVDDINEPTPCTLLYVKDKRLRTIEVVDAIVILLVSCMVGLSRQSVQCSK